MYLNRRKAAVARIAEIQKLVMSKGVTEAFTKFACFVDSHHEDPFDWHSLLMHPIPPFHVVLQHLEGAELNNTDMVELGFEYLTQRKYQLSTGTSIVHVFKHTDTGRILEVVQNYVLATGRILSSEVREGGL